MMLFTLPVVFLTEQISEIIQDPSVTESINTSASSIIDWHEAINAAVGTFIGILSAVISSWVYDYIKEKRDKKQLIESLKEELDGVLSEIEKADSYLREEVSSASRDHVLLVNPLKSYIWESVVSNSSISSISNENWYRTLLSIYHSVKEYNTWELMRTQRLLEGANVEGINEALLEEGRALTEDIKKLFKIWGC